MKLEGLNIEELVQSLNDAPAEEKSAKIIEAIQLAVNESKKEIVERYQREFAEVQANKDNFAKYGLRNLNSEEKSFIDKLKDPKQLAVFSTNDQDELIPTSITNYVFEDLRQEHPFLKYVKFTPAGVKKWILSEASGKAKWGKIDAKIIDEITAALSEIDMDANKLSAFAFIPKGILDLGYEWIERYIREVLLEVNEDGLEEGFIAGDGKNAPIGLLKKLSGAVDGVYPDRTANVIEDFSVKSLGEHFLTLTNNGKRKVGKVLMIVNPADAYTKVAEASTYLNASGEFKKVFPFAIEVVESVHVPVNKAILYIPYTYVGGISRMGISFSDQYQFLEDNRVYKIVTYGNGRLVHENQAVVLDITNVKPLSFNVKVVSDEEIGSL
jgi:HK97 family phage major capsid protein